MPISNFKWVLLTSFMLSANPSYAQQPVAGLDCERRPGRPPISHAEQEAAAKLANIKLCKSGVDDRTACNRFVGMALERLFGNIDFKSGSNSYMLANDIANGLEQPGNARWIKIGQAAEQGTLDRAQALANEGKPVIAASLGRPRADGSRGPGHVALIIPGALEKVEFADGYSWGALRAPNSASFFLDRPDKFFIGCPLSAVWRKPDGVSIYFKNLK